MREFFYLLRSVFPPLTLPGNAFKTMRMVPGVLQIQKTLPGLHEYAQNGKAPLHGGGAPDSRTALIMCYWSHREKVRDRVLPPVKTLPVVAIDLGP